MTYCISTPSRNRAKLWIKTVQILSVHLVGWLSLMCFRRRFALGTGGLSRQFTVVTDTPFSADSDLSTLPDFNTLRVMDEEAAQIPAGILFRWTLWQKCPSTIRERDDVGSTQVLAGRSEDCPHVGGLCRNDSGGDMNRIAAR